MNILKLNKAASSKTPFTSMYNLIPEKKKSEFMAFAKQFGFTEEKLKEVLTKEKKNGK